MVEEALFSLLRQAFGLIPPSEPHLSAEQWRQLLAVAREQAVSGWVYLALTGLPEASGVPVDVLDAVMVDSVKTMQRSVKVSQALEEIRTGVDGVQPIVMKGPSVAVYYPRPELRMSGDLDLYVNKKEQPALLSWLENKGYLLFQSPDGAWLGRRDGLYIDLHRSYFDLTLPADHLPPIPSREAEIYMLSLHILKHAMGPGIGLRQVCDLAMALRAPGYNPQLLKRYFDRNRLGRWNRMLCSFIQNRFGIDSGMYTKNVSYKALEGIVLGGGDFGRYGQDRESASASGARLRKMDTGKRLLRRLPFALRYAPLRYFKYVLTLLKGNVCPA